MPDTSRRTQDPEMMDDFSLQGKDLADALEKIAEINRLLGGNRVTLGGVRKLLRNNPHRVIKIADTGCGNGDMLRVLARFASSRGLHFELTGIDANPFTIRLAGELSAGYPNIRYICKNLLDDAANQEAYDIILCTLTLHHFTDAEIEGLLRRFERQTSLGIVINDLNRNVLAYHLFRFVCWFFSLNRLSRQDGLTSILRGFKKSELQRFSIHISRGISILSWKWAFRYQWIIDKHER